MLTWRVSLTRRELILWLYVVAARIGRRSPQYISSTSRTEWRKYLCGYNAEQHSRRFSAKKVQPSCIRPWQTTVGSGGSSWWRSLCHRGTRQEYRSLAETQAVVDYSGKFRQNINFIASGTWMRLVSSTAKSYLLYNLHKPHIKHIYTCVLLSQSHQRHSLLSHLHKIW